MSGGEVGPRDRLIERVAFAIYSNFIRHDPRASDRWARLPEMARLRWCRDAEVAIAEIEALYGPIASGAA